MGIATVTCPICGTEIAFGVPKGGSVVGVTVEAPDDEHGTFEGDGAMRAEHGRPAAGQDAEASGRHAESETGAREQADPNGRTGIPGETAADGVDVEKAEEKEEEVDVSVDTSSEGWPGDEPTKHRAVSCPSGHEFGIRFTA